MISVQNANAIAEVVYYLKGIRQEDIDKIPKKLLEYLNNNASKEYECNFDFNKPLNELELLEETRGIIGMICYNYWCETEEQKANYLKKINQNEQKYQEELRKKYNTDNIFKKDDNTMLHNSVEGKSLMEYKESFFIKIKNYILKLLRLKNKH